MDEDLGITESARSVASGSDAKAAGEIDCASDSETDEVGRIGRAAESGDEFVKTGATGRAEALYVGTAVAEDERFSAPDAEPNVEASADRTRDVGSNEASDFTSETESLEISDAEEAGIVRGYVGSAERVVASDGYFRFEGVVCCVSVY